MKTRIIFLSLFVFSFAMVGHCEDEKPSDRLYGYIADYVVNADRVLKQRHVCVAKGTLIFGDTERARPKPVWFVRAVDSRTERLDAQSSTSNSSLGMIRENWRQQLQTEKGYWRRDAPLQAGRQRFYKLRKEMNEKEREQVTVLEPFDQAVSEGGAFISGGPPMGSIQELLATQLRLNKCTQIGLGDLKAEFMVDSRKDKWTKIEVTFAKDAGYMVTEYVLSCKRKPNGKSFIVFEHSQTEWTKADDIYLPVKFESTKPAMKAEYHIKLDLHWKIGDEVPPNIVDPTLDDWREPIRVLFDFDWQRKGQRSPLINPREKKQ
ncbi:MAG: hypothetical protein WBD20_10855 [Pirellulaceae bacterium]